MRDGEVEEADTEGDGTDKAGGVGEEVDISILGHQSDSAMLDGLHMLDIITGSMRSKLSDGEEDVGSTAASEP